MRFSDIQIDFWNTSHCTNRITASFQGCFCRRMFLGSHSFPYQSLLLSTFMVNDTTVLNDTMQVATYVGTISLKLCGRISIPTCVCA